MANTKVALRRRPHGALRIVGGPAAGGGGGVCTLVRTTVGSTTCQQTAMGTPTASVDCGTVATGDLLIGVMGGTVNNDNSNPVAWVLAKTAGSATIDTITSAGTAVGATAGAYAKVSTFYCQVTAGGTLTLGGSGTGSFGHYGFDLVILKYTGHDTATPVVSGVTQTEGISSPHVGGWTPTTATLANTPIANDEVLVVVDADVDNGVSGKGWDSGTYAEVFEQTDTTGYCMTTVAVRTGSTSTTITWPSEDDTPIAYSYAGVAFIVKAGTNCGAVTVLPRQRRFPFVAISSKVARA